MHSGPVVPQRLISLATATSRRTKEKEKNKDAIRDSHEQLPITCPMGWFCTTLGNTCSPVAVREPILRLFGAGWPRSGLSLEHLTFSLHPDAHPGLNFGIKHPPGRRKHAQESFPQLCSSPSLLPLPPAPCSTAGFCPARQGGRAVTVSCWVAAPSDENYPSNDAACTDATHRIVTTISLRCKCQYKS